MKRTALILCVTAAFILPSCITLTGKISLPGGDKPGSIGGEIGGTWTWPLPTDSQPLGKNPVLPPP